MSKKTTEVMNIANEDSLALITGEIPQETGFQKIYLPRIIFVAKTKLDENEDVKYKAGTFLIQRSVEVDGERQWREEVIGQELEANFIFHRRQLRYYDEANEQYINSPVYDKDSDIVPLFSDKKEIDRGTQKELQAKYPPKEGRKTPSLEDERVLYVLYKGELYEMNIKGGSKYAFMKFAKSVSVGTKTVVVTHEDKEKGSNKWKQMVFTVLRTITQEEADVIIGKIREIKEGIIAEKEHFSDTNHAVEASEKEYAEITEVKVF